LAESRASMVAQLGSRFGEIAAGLSPSLEGVELEVRRGWDSSMSLREALEKSVPSDRDRGFTQVGPHRADIRIRLGGRAASDNLSRGQSKLVLSALKLAQGKVLTELAATPPVCLVDDIVAELDQSHAERVCGLLADQGGQVFMTAVEQQSLRRFWPNEMFKMFHVEHGFIQAVTD